MPNRFMYRCFAHSYASFEVMTVTDLNQSLINIATPAALYREAVRAGYREADLRELGFGPTAARTIATNTGQPYNSGDCITTDFPLPTTLDPASNIAIYAASEETLELFTEANFYLRVEWAPNSTTNRRMPMPTFTTSWIGLTHDQRCWVRPIAKRHHIIDSSIANPGREQIIRGYPAAFQNAIRDYLTAQGQQVHVFQTTSGLGFDDEPIRFLASDKDVSQGMRYRTLADVLDPTAFRQP